MSNPDDDRDASYYRCQAALDQAQAAFEDIAKAAGDFKARLIEAGIGAEAADRMVQTWFAALFNRPQ